AKIIGEVEKYPCRHAVVTGGEPLLASDIEALTAELKRIGKHITIETAATIFKPIACDLVSLSPKLAHSTPWKKAGGQFAGMHERRRLNLPVIQKFIDAYDYQLKFVVERRSDFDEIKSLLEKLHNVDLTRVLIMAQGTTKKQLDQKARWIVELCKEYGYGYTPRLHIELFGNRRGT
ncbi:MAG TPA: radical SAM protein, partial [Methylomirabilota bacterium]|nr:radical SAM protein [Methylomirabilota bacterium]